MFSSQYLGILLVFPDIVGRHKEHGIHVGAIMMCRPTVMGWYEQVLNVDLQARVLSNVDLMCIWPRAAGKTSHLRAWWQQVHANNKAGNVPPACQKQEKLFDVMLKHTRLSTVSALLLRITWPVSCVLTTRCCVGVVFILFFVNRHEWRPCWPSSWPYAAELSMLSTPHVHCRQIFLLSTVPVSDAALLCLLVGPFTPCLS